VEGVRFNDSGADQRKIADAIQVEQRVNNGCERLHIPFYFLRDTS